MMRIAVLMSLCSIACVNVQDLGSDRAPEPERRDVVVVPRTNAPLARATETNPTSCPSAIPLESSSCANVAWCSYPLDGSGGLAAKCGCSLGHWSCLRVRDEDRRTVLPIAELPLTAASCTEGATCDEGTKCKLAMERWCECTSSGRLRCHRPTH